MSFKAAGHSGSNGSGKEDVPVSLMEETFDFMDGDEHGLDGGDLEQEVDEVSNVLLTRFQEAPIPHGEVDSWRSHARILRFKLNPNGIDGVGFISQDPDSNKIIKCYPQETKIYTSTVPTFDDNDLYVDYVSNLYSIYDALGDDKYFSVQTTGLVKRDAQKKQVENLNKAMDITIGYLETYIEERIKNEMPETGTFELEEALIIINCLKVLYFALDYEIPSLLAVWANKADPQPEKEFADSIMRSEKPYTHPYFWKFIKQLTLRGLYSQAAIALRDSKFQELQKTDITLYNLFIDTFNLLQSYPENSPLEAFKQWKSAASKAATNASIRNPNHQEMTKNLRTLLNIIAGNKTTILEESSTWYEALIALIYYQIPSAELLSEYFGLVSERFQPDHTSIWELACCDLIQGNFLQALRAISSFDNATAAYISALCEARGLLRGYSLDETEIKKLAPAVLLDQDLFSTINPSEFLLHTHAMDCLSIEKLVPVGIGLLASSRNPTARSVIAEYLPRYNFQTNEDLEWALTVCASLKLPQVAHSLFRIAAQRSLSIGRTLEALTLFARAGEVSYVKHYTWVIFENSLLKGGPIDNDDINAVVSDVGPETLQLSPLLRQTLAPYAVLYQFWKFKEEGSLRLALTKLISLLRFPHLPSRLFGILISQLLPFIIFMIPPKVLLQKDLLSVVKILDKFESSILKKNDKKSLKLRTECDDLYKFSIKSKRVTFDNYWVEQLKGFDIKVPEDLQSLLIMIRRNLAIEIGRAFLEDEYN